MVRCFDNDDVIHVSGNVDPLRDIDTIDTELMLADLESLDKRVKKNEKIVKSNKDQKLKAEFDL